MPKQLKSAEVVLGILLLAFAGYSLYAFSQAEASVKASIIAGLVAVFSLILTQRRDREKAVREAHRDKKIEVYSKFYDLIFEFMKATKKGVELDLESEEFHSKFIDLNRGVMFYGSTSVILAYSEFKVQSHDTESNPLLVMKRVGMILLAMREDIGLDNTGVDELSITQVIVNDDLRRLGANS